MRNLLILHPMDTLFMFAPELHSHGQGAYGLFSEAQMQNSRLEITGFTVLLLLTLTVAILN